MAYDPNARFDGDAFVPALAAYDLARVPGHDDLNPGWRQEWRDWANRVGSVREAIVAAAATSPAFRAGELAICAEDIGYWAAVYGWIEEPRAVEGEDTIKPFLPFAFQVKLLQQMVELAGDPKPADIYVSKTRGLGASWVFCYFAIWGWLFREWRGHMVSRREDLVDKPLDLNSLFGKLDFIIKWLPGWIKPEGFTPKDHRLKLLLKNPVTGAQVTGESTTARTGRGGRATYALEDETAFYEFRPVHNTLAGTTRHRFCVSTESYEFGDEWEQAWQSIRTETRNAAERGETIPHKVWELDWWHNAYFDEEWYEAERERAIAAHDLDGFEREVNRNPAAGFGSWVYPTARTLPVVHRGYLPHDVLLVSIDPGHADDTAIVWGQPTYRDGNRGVHWLDSYERNLTPVEWYAHMLTGVPPAPGDECWGMEPTDREAEVMAFFRSLPQGNDRVRFYMDPAGAQQHNAISFYALFTRKAYALRQRVAKPVDTIAPISLLYKALHGKGRLLDERRYAMNRALLHSSYEKCAGGERIKEAHSNYRFGEETGKTSGEPKPIHNKHSHITTACEYAYMYQSMGLADPFKPKAAIVARDRTPAALRVSA